MVHFDSNVIECASWAKSIQPSIMQKMLEASSNPNIIRFSLGLPNPNLFPILELQKSIENILHANSKALQYAPPSFSLKQQIVKLMATRNVICNESQIFLTTGAQQAISLLSRLLLNVGGKLVTESLTYPGFLQIVAPLSPHIISYPTHFQNGPCLISLENILKNKKDKPAFIYTIPDGHNPLGISLSNEHRQQLASLSRVYQVPIIEDDAYGFLYYDKPTTPICAYENRWVFYVGTFSKIIAPSLRVGWMIVPEELIANLSYIKEATDINTTSFAQNVIEEFLNRGVLNEHLNKLRCTYKLHRDVMMQSIKQYFPEGTKTSSSNHGFFIWVELPHQLNTSNLFYKALKENIAFMPGEVFTCNSKQNSHSSLRLNFSHCEPPLIEIGIKKLGEIINNELIVKKTETQCEIL